MATKLLAATMIFCSAAYGASGTKAVGTATVRGSISLDGNPVTADATLFDGSAVETSTSSAMLNFSSSRSVVEIATNSRSVVHEDYISIQHGAIDVKPTCGFVVEYNGVRIVPDTLNAHGVVTVTNSSASISTRSGEFLITDSHGRVLGKAHSGSSFSFGAGQLQSTSSTNYAGNLSIVDGHHLLTPFAPDTGLTYELQGHNADKIQNGQVEVDGSIDSKQSSALSQVGEVISTTKETAMCKAKAASPLLLGAAAAAAAGGAAAFAVGGSSSNPTTGVSVTNTPVPPASK